MPPDLCLLQAAAAAIIPNKNTAFMFRQKTELLELHHQQLVSVRLRAAYRLH
jgi:hypothetical protein